MPAHSQLGLTPPKTQKTLCLIALLWRLIGIGFSSIAPQIRSCGADRVRKVQHEELVAVDVAISTQSFHIVCIDEPTQIRVVVPAAQIVQTGFFIKDVAAIPEGVQGTQRIGQRARLAGGLAPSIVLVFYYLAAVCVNQRDDVALESVCASARILQGRQRKI